MILVISTLGKFTLVNKHKKFDKYEELSDYLRDHFNLSLEEIDNVYDGCTLSVDENKWVYLAEGEWLS